MDSTVVNATEMGGWTTIEFTRKLQTGDPWDIQITDDKTKFYIIYAYADQDGNADGTTYPMHTMDGAEQVDFKSTAPVSTIGSSNLFGIKFRLSPGYTLLLIVAAVVAIWACIHWVKIAHKRVTWQRITQQKDFNEKFARSNTFVNSKKTPFFAADPSASFNRESFDFTHDPACPTDPSAVYFNNEGTLDSTSGPSSPGNADRPPVGVVHRKGFYQGSSLVSRGLCSCFTLIFFYPVIYLIILSFSRLPHSHHFRQRRFLEFCYRITQS